MRVATRVRDCDSQSELQFRAAPADGAARSRRDEVALVHDWLTGMRGGEKVLEAICELYPDATLFTLVHVPRRGVAARSSAHRIARSFVQWLPGAGAALPAIPAALSRRRSSSSTSTLTIWSISTQPLRGRSR